MENEIWKDVVGYEGLYQVFSFGRVKKLFKSGKEKMMRPSLTYKNYLVIRFRKNKISKVFSVHRLVAIAFIPNPDNLPQVNHRDEDKSNNHVENLEWCTAKYNTNYGTRNKRASKSRIARKCCCKSVDQFTLDGKFIKTWPSMQQITRDLGINNIYKCCQGKIRQAGGFVWKYHQDP